MAALWPSLMWPPFLEAIYHAKTGVQKDFIMKLCLGEIMGGKAHKMIIQYSFATYTYNTKIRRNVQSWLMAQMKAYTMPMKKCTLLSGPFHLPRLFSKT